MGPAMRRPWTGLELNQPNLPMFPASGVGCSAFELRSSRAHVRGLFSCVPTASQRGRALDPARETIDLLGDVLDCLGFVE